MSLLDEQIVEEWLNRRGFFTTRGVKVGLGEIDLLAVRLADGSPECWHVECQISFRPIGYLGGNTNARRRSEADVKVGIDQWHHKKFCAPNKVEEQQRLIPGSTWKQFLVHAEFRHKSEMPLLRELGVELISYRSILRDLVDEKKTLSSSIGTNIIEIIRYLNSAQPPNASE